MKPARFTLLIFAALLLLPACRSVKSGPAEPWARQTRRETEREWLFQNRYPDTRPSAFGPDQLP